jgi:uncharacterized protein (TIGR00251 family)|tara:strand:- start:2548 stop:2883 length:336 start_codon:yes stop_codon:yes gene_type:complete
MIKIEELASILRYCKEDSTNISIYVQPNSTILGIIGMDIWRTCLKISLVSPPINGKANLELQKYMSNILEVSARDVSILSGHKSRKKIITVNLPLDILLTKLERIIGINGS